MRFKAVKEDMLGVWLMAAKRVLAETDRRHARVLLALEHPTRETKVLYQTCPSALVWRAYGDPEFWIANV